eukprot:9964185-Prorocentrum_lima.AAC.1
MVPSNSLDELFHRRNTSWGRDVLTRTTEPQRLGAKWADVIILAPMLSSFSSAHFSNSFLLDSRRKPTKQTTG